MSFFDEVDEPPRRPARSQSRPRRPSGRGRPPRDQQAIQTRRTVAVVVLVVLVVLIALGVHSCDVSATNSALKDYNNSVYSIIQSSDATGQQVFRELGAAGGAGAGQTRQNQLYAALGSARQQLIQAENLSVPDQMQAAQRHLVFALTMRRDGIAVIARQIQPALGTTTNRDAINAIAGATAHFYASDVVYKAYAVPEIAGALAAAGIPVGGVGGQAINGGQFLPALGWLHPSFIAGRLGSKLPGARGVNSNAPGRHGHSLDSVSVGSNTMSTAATNHVAANPAPTFTLSVTNGGQFNQFGIGCRVAITGLNDTGTGTIAETTPGQTTSCSVTLPHPPTPGIYSVTASISTVPGETNAANNSETFTVQFT